MTPSQPPGETVLVGATRRRAAELFGTWCDHAFLTSYADFPTEVRTAGTGTFGLVADEAMTETLAHIIAAPTGDDRQRPALVIALSPDLRDLETAEQALARHPEVSVAEVVSHPRHTLLHLADAAQVSPSDAARVGTDLAALREAARNHLPGPAAPPTPAPSRSPDEAPSTGPGGDGPRDGSGTPAPPRPPRRRRRLAAGAAVLVALGTAALGAVVATLLGDTALLVLLLVGVVLGTLGVLGAQWHLLRVLRQQAAKPSRPRAGDLGGDRPGAPRRTPATELLLQRSLRQQAEQSAALAALADDVAATQARVMAIGRLLARQEAADRALR